MKKIAALLFSLVLLAGCAQTAKLNVDTPEKIATTDKAQDAVFRIGLGWTGGMGSYPIFTEGGNGPKQYNDLPVYLDDQTAEKLLEGKLPGCTVGRPLVKISANITLEQKSGTNYSIPPDASGKQPEEKYYSAKINKLYDILVKAEECKE